MTASHSPPSHSFEIIPGCAYLVMGFLSKETCAVVGPSLQKELDALDCSTIFYDELVSLPASIDLVRTQVAISLGWFLGSSELSTAHAPGSSSQVYAEVGFGGSRVVTLSDAAGNELSEHVLGDGDMLVMHGQKDDIRRNISSEPDTRLSLTFHRHLGP